MKGNFNQLIHGEKPVLIDFYATWCGPCKALEPTIQAVAASMKSKIKVIKIDVDKNQTLANKLNVRGVPTLVLFQKGKIIWRQSGGQTKDQIISMIEKNVSA